mgnify:FL=1
MRLPLTVVDNFFETPTLVRNFALQQEFFKGDRGNWPGIRTKFLDELDINFFNTFHDKLLNYIPRNYKGFQHLEATFQLIDETYKRGWVHNDDPKWNVAGIVYLNNDKPKQDCGTTFYDDRDTSNDDDHSKEYSDDVNDNIGQNEDVRDKVNSRWVPSMLAENRWNRCVISDSTRWHSAGRFFGHNKETSRLTLVFFGRVI